MDGSDRDNVDELRNTVSELKVQSKASHADILYGASAQAHALGSCASELDLMLCIAQLHLDHVLCVLCLFTVSAHFFALIAGFGNGRNNGAWVSSRRKP